MNEGKTDELHIRMKPSTKAAIREATRRRGCSVTKLVTDGALREAGRELARAQRQEAADE